MPEYNDLISNVTEYLGVNISQDANFAFILNQSPNVLVANPWDIYVIGVFNYLLPLQSYISLNKMLDNRLVFMSIDTFNYIYIVEHIFEDNNALWYLWGYKNQEDAYNCKNGLAISAIDFEVLNKFLLANSIIRGKYDMKESVYLNEDSDYVHNPTY